MATPLWRVWKAWLISNWGPYKIRLQEPPFPHCADIPQRRIPSAPQILPSEHLTPVMEFCKWPGRKKRRGDATRGRGECGSRDRGLRGRGGEATRRRGDTATRRVWERGSRLSGRGGEGAKRRGAVLRLRVLDEERPHQICGGNVVAAIRSAGPHMPAALNGVKRHTGAVFAAGINGAVDRGSLIACRSG